MALPRRSRPYARQARTQGRLRYGSEEHALRLLARGERRDLRTASRSAAGAARGIADSAASARPEIRSIYENAGLTDVVRQGLTANPAARRLAETMASAEGELLSRQVQAKEGAAFAINQQLSGFRKAMEQINARRTGLAKEKGLFVSSLLGEMIGDDRTARRESRAQFRDQQFKASQQAVAGAQSERNALIGQGLDPSTGRLLPGEKAKNRRSGPSKPKPSLTLNQRNSALDQITAARGAYRTASSQRGFNPSGLREGLRVGSLPTADGKTIRLPRVTSDIYITAGFELAHRGHLTAKTLRELKRRGLRIPGSWRQPGVQRPGLAPGANGQQRPT